MKKVVLFVTAIALVIAIAATGVLAESKAPEVGNVDAGRVDETLESEEKVYDRPDWTDDMALKKAVEAKYTVGTLRDFGIDEDDGRIIYSDSIDVFPISEYKELDESLQFLKDCDVYLLIEMVPEVRGDSNYINELMLEYVEFMRKDIDSRIADGTMDWNSGRVINVVQAQFLWDEIFYAVAEYYYGYTGGYVK